MVPAYSVISLQDSCLPGLLTLYVPIYSLLCIPILLNASVDCLVSYALSCLLCLCLPICIGGLLCFPDLLYKASYIHACMVSYDPYGYDCLPSHLCFPSLLCRMLTYIYMASCVCLHVLIMLGLLYMLAWYPMPSWSLGLLCVPGLLRMSCLNLLCLLGLLYAYSQPCMVFFDLL